MHRSAMRTLTDDRHALHPCHRPEAARGEFFTWKGAFIILLILVAVTYVGIQVFDLSKNPTTDFDQLVEMAKRPLIPTCAVGIIALVVGLGWAISTMCKSPLLSKDGDLPSSRDT